MFLHHNHLVDISFSGYSYDMPTSTAKLCECSDIGGH